MSFRRSAFAVAAGVYKLPSSPSAAAVSSLARTSQRQAAAKSRAAMLPINGFASRQIHTRPNNLIRHNIPDAYAIRQVPSASQTQGRFHSAFSNNGNRPPRNERGAIGTLSTLSNIFAAGTGTFASTLFALYLATVVETSAHETLYEYFPLWYADVREEDLPHCLMDREVARRATNLVQSNRARGVESDVAGGLMGVDGWMELEEGELEGDQSATAASAWTWQRKLTLKRERIVEREERDFSRGFAVAGLEGAKTGAVERKKAREEAPRKLQERLVSLAMTA